MGATIDDLMGVDYSKPLEGLHDSSVNLSFGFPKKQFAAGMAVALFAEFAHTAVPLYYSLARPDLGGTRMVREVAGERLFEGALYFIPGFIFGAAVSHNRKVREGGRGRDRSLIARIYNSVFEHPEMAAIPASILFYLNYNAYSVLDLEPKNIIAGVAYSGDIFRSCIAGIAAYCAATFAGSFLHLDSLRMVRDAALSRVFEAFGKFGQAANYQKRIAELPSLFSGKNHARLGDLYAKAGLVLEAIDEYAFGLKPENSKSVPPDIYGLPVYLFQALVYEERDASPGDVLGKIRLAAMRFRAGKLGEADLLFREAILADPAKRLPHYVYSHFLRGIRRNEEGEREQEIANRIRFSSGDPFGGLEEVQGTRNRVYIERVRL